MFNATFCPSIENLLIYLTYIHFEVTVEHFHDPQTVFHAEIRWIFHFLLFLYTNIVRGKSKGPCSALCWLSTKTSCSSAVNQQKI